MNRLCRGCSTPIEPSVRERNPRCWCSESCRVSAGYRSGRYKSSYGPKSAIGYADCAHCGRLFVLRRAKRATDVNLGCGAECRRLLRNERSKRWQREFKAEHGRCQRGGLVDAQCIRCGATYAGRKDGKYCSRDCYQAVVSELYVTEGLHRTKHRRRKQRLRDAHVESVSRHAVLERDRWRCHLCGKKIRKTLQYPHPESASLDHVIPLSSGGSHEMANVHAAHLICNVRKRDRGGNEQLMLIG